MLDIIFVGVILVILLYIIIQIYNKNDKEQHLKNQVDFQHEYNLYANRLGIVKSNIQATLIESDEGLPLSIPHYLWIKNGSLNLFPMAEYYKFAYTNSISKPNISRLQLKSVPIDAILYFEEIGELRKYAKVSGGSVSLKGVILDTILDSNILSREPITTTIVSEDERKIELVYKNQQNQIASLEFRHDAYEVLQKLIPSKELRKIIALNEIQKKDSSNTDEKEFQNTKQKLKQLNDLKEEGLITDEEFLEQKRKILDVF